MYTLVSGNAGDKKNLHRAADIFLKSIFQRYSIFFFSFFCLFCILRGFFCLFVCFLKLEICIFDTHSTMLAGE